MVNKLLTYLLTYLLICFQSREHLEYLEHREHAAALDGRARRSRKEAPHEGERR